MESAIKRSRTAGPDDSYQDETLVGLAGRGGRELEYVSP